jgi:hypothetical protein
VKTTATTAHAASPCPRQRPCPRENFSSSITSDLVDLSDRGDGVLTIRIGSGSSARGLNLTDSDLVRFVRQVAKWHPSLVVIELPDADETVTGSHTQLGVVHPTISDDGSPLVGFMAHKDHLAVTPQDAEHAAAALLACARRPVDPGVVQRAMLADVIAGATGLSPGCTEAWQQSVTAITDAVLDRFDLMPREA